MPTRSTIAMEYDNGKVKKVYCHFDGYHDGVGKMLSLNYNNPVIIDALLSKGKICSLGETIETTEFYNEKENDFETFFGISVYNCSQMEQYNYIFRNGKWNVFMRAVINGEDTNV